MQRKKYYGYFSNNIKMPPNRKLNLGAFFHGNYEELQLEPQLEPPSLPQLEPQE